MVSKDSNMLSISIVTPTYNSKGFIDRLYNSILIQVGVNIEWIIVDDGSSDNTIELISRYEDSNTLIIKKYKLDQNSGGGAAIARGVELATGDAIMIIDHDDELFPNAFSTLKSDWAKLKNDDAGLCYRRVDPIKNEIIGGELEVGLRFTASWQKNLKPEITDMNFLIKSNIMKKYLNLDSMKGITMMGVIWCQMSKLYKFVAGAQIPFIKYHRDNQESQTLKVSISDKTIYTYANYLNCFDKYYLSNIMFWLRFTVSLIVFSILLGRRPLYSLKYLTNPVAKIMLFILSPIGMMRAKYLDVKRFNIVTKFNNFHTEKYLVDYLDEKS